MSFNGIKNQFETYQEVEFKSNSTLQNRLIK